MGKLDPSMAAWDVGCISLSQRPFESQERAQMPVLGARQRSRVAKGSRCSRGTLKNRAESNRVGQSEQKYLVFLLQMKTERGKKNHWSLDDCF